MKRTLKKSLIILIMTLVALILWTGNAKAASASMSSTGSVTVGQNVSVTINFGEKMKAIQFRLQYDTSKLDFVKVNVGGYGAGTQSFIYANSFDEADVSSVTFTFKSKASGAANFSASGFILSNATQDGLSANTASAITTIKEKETPKPDTKPDNKPSTDPGTTTKPSTDKKPTFSGGSQKVYATETVSIRESWSKDSKLLGTLQKNASITRTGIGSNGWDRVTFNGRTAYISHTYLTTTKPKDENDKDKDKDKDKNNTTNETNNNTANNEVANNTLNNETNDITNNETNEATNTQIQGNIEKDDKKGFSVNTIEIIIISVIILAIIVIIINEILAKKREEKRRAARKKEEKRVKGSRR